jgi:hypothetical protein
VATHRGLDGRHRNVDGEIHKKRSDTKLETLRKIYGSDFLAGVRSDAQLGTIEDRTGKTLAELVKEHRNP